MEKVIFLANCLFNVKARIFKYFSDKYLTIVATDFNQKQKQFKKVSSIF